MEQKLTAAKAAIEVLKSDPHNKEKHLNAGKLSLFALAAMPDAHYFCNEELQPVGEACLVMLSFKEAKVFYDNKISDLLLRCGNCARMYHVLLMKLRNNLEHIFRLDHVDAMMKLITGYDDERLTKNLNMCAEIIRQKKQLTLDEAKDVINPMFEVMCYPMLRDQKNIVPTFKLILSKLISMPGLNSLAIGDILPGTLILLFGNDPELHQWSRKGLDSLATPSDSLDIVTLDTFNRICNEASTISLNEHGLESLRRFWFNIGLVVNRLSSTAIIDQLYSQDGFNLVKYLCQDILLLSSGRLHFVLRAFAMLLRQLGPQFWNVVGRDMPMRNVVRSILENPHYCKGFSEVLAVDAVVEYDKDYKNQLSDLTDWIDPALEAGGNTEAAAAESQKIGNLIFSGLLNLSQSGYISDDGIRELITKKGLMCAHTSFMFKINDNLPLLEEVNILVRIDTRNVIYAHSGLIFSKLTSEYAELSSTAFQLINLSIAFDVINGMPDNANINRSEVENSKIPPSFTTSLWDSLNSRPKLYDEKLSKVVLGALKDSAFISHPPVKKIPDYLPKKALSKAALKSTIDSLKVISELDGLVIKNIIQDFDSLVAIFLNLFAYRDDQSESAVDILCQTFDNTDRLNALRCLLGNDIKMGLRAFCTAVDRVRTLQLFSACSKLIKVGQDIWDSLFDSREGILDDKYQNQLSKGQENELLKCWNCNWEFLKFSFHMSYPWSSQFKAEFMLEFLRDELDYCQKLLGIFRLIEKALPVPLIGARSNGETLMIPAMNTVEYMCTLLRLKDESLVITGFRNIITIINLMKSFHITFPDQFIKLFVKMATNEIKNIMPREQHAQLLASTDQFSNDQIDEILAKNPAFNEVEIIESRTTPQATTPVPTTQKIDKKPAERVERSEQPATQRTLNDFVRMSSVPVPPKPPISNEPAAPARTSMMESVRQDLMNSRSLSSLASGGAKIPPSKDVHPPRPAGFNSNRSKRLQANGQAVSQLSGNRATHSSSESSEDESDDGLFTVKKKATASIAGKAVPIEPLRRSRPSAMQISEKEREERNMRQRLQIDLNPLYRKILTWNYHSSDEYPDGNRDYKAVGATFNSVEEYQKIFEPLLLLECWQGILRAKDEDQSSPFKIHVGHRVACDEFNDIHASMQKSEWSKAGISDSDLIVMTYYPTEEPKARYPSKSHAYCLAKVREVTPSTSPEFVDLQLRTFNPGKMLTYLAPRTELHGLKVMSLTTIEREYCSVRGLPFYDLKDNIIKGQPTPLPSFESSALSVVQSNYGVNGSQARAILGAVSTQGFSLIQGPPGTGKTKTILGVIGQFLKSQKPVQENNSNATSNPENMKRILVCAPSNAAVDELVLRLKGGIMISGSTSNFYYPKVVRLGRSDAIHASVKELTLEDQIDKALENLDRETANNELFEQQKATKAKRDKLRDELRNTRDMNADEYLQKEEELKELNRKMKDLGHQLDLQRDRLKMDARNRDIQRRNTQKKILTESQVICATLSGSAHSVLASLQMRFNTVIIDEAAQCIELSALIPLKYGCKQCIMVGDPNQLPPTVLSQRAMGLKYEQSLFFRMFNRFENSVHLLNVQFRMNPAISKFPSSQFYNGKLMDGDRMSAETARPWHSLEHFGPYRFFNVVDGKHDRSSTKSLYNDSEINVAMEIFFDVTAAMADEEVQLDNRVGIISPYKQQVRRLKDRFTTEFGQQIENMVDFNTIDGFQGQEKDIIILSCVRASADHSSTRGIGFLADIRRMNVAITRAKSSLWILGNENSLNVNPIWKRLIDDTKARGMFTNVRLEYNSARGRRMLKFEDPAYNHKNGNGKNKIDEKPRSDYSNEDLQTSKRKTERERERERKPSLPINNEDSEEEIEEIHMSTSMSRHTSTLIKEEREENERAKKSTDDNVNVNVNVNDKDGKENTNGYSDAQREIQEKIDALKAKLDKQREANETEESISRESSSQGDRSVTAADPRLALLASPAGKKKGEDKKEVVSSKAVVPAKHTDELTSSSFALPSKPPAPPPSKSFAPPVASEKRVTSSGSRPGKREYDRYADKDYARRSRSNRAQYGKEPTRWDTTTGYTSAGRLGDRISGYQGSIPAPQNSGVLSSNSGSYRTASPPTPPPPPPPHPSSSTSSRPLAQRIEGTGNSWQSSSPVAYSQNSHYDRYNSSYDRHPRGPAYNSSWEGYRPSSSSVPPPRKKKKPNVFIPPKR